MYMINEYDTRYKPTNKSGGELKNADYVKLPVNPKGDGLQALLEHKKGLEVFGIWCLLLEKTTAQKPETRGKLLNHQDDPASFAEIAKSISLKGREHLVEYALNLLVAMGWVIQTDVAEISSEEFRNRGAKLSKDKISKGKLKEVPETSGTSECVFDVARKKYPGTKRGLPTEFENYRKKHKDWREVLPLLEPAVIAQAAKWRADGTQQRYIPNFKTWINNRNWEARHGPDETERREAEARALEKKRAEVRKEYHSFYSAKTTAELNDMRKDEHLTTHWWLIDEILKERHVE